MILYRDIMKFPSLTGVIRFLIVTIQEDEFAENFTSLTGLIHFLMYQIRQIWNKCQRNRVSVPYRGYSFFNRSLKNILVVMFLMRFPSLTGVIHFLILTQAELSRRFEIPVSVPYRGYSFFNILLKEPFQILPYQRFRPLQGLFVF